MPQKRANDRRKKLIIAQRSGAMPRVSSLAGPREPGPAAARRGRAGRAAQPVAPGAKSRRISTSVVAFVGALAVIGAICAVLVAHALESAPPQQAPARPVAAQEQDPRLVEALSALREGDEAERVEAVGTIGTSFSQDDVVDPLVAALGDPSAAVREKAAWALGMTRDDRARAPVWNAAASDASLDVRKSAIAAIGDLKDPGAIGFLIDALDVAATRKVAAAALARIGHPAVEPLLARLSSSHVTVDIDVADAEKQLGDGVVGVLIGYMPPPSDITAVAAE